MPLVTKAFSEIITFTRASSGTYFDATGTLQTATTNAARFDYDPSTLSARGFLVEEQRTNSIRNNTMAGAVAGTPGTLPTNWSVFSANGLSTNVVGTGTSNGINYIDLRINGTSTNTFYVLAFDSTGASTTTVGQQYAASLWAAIVGGSTSNISAIQNQARQLGGAGPTANETITLTASLSRFTGSAAVVTTVTSVTSVTSCLALTFANGVAIDITLRIGLPQLEQGAFATSVISTSSAAATRSADVASVNTLSPWYNASEGTFFAETQLASTSARGAAGFDANDGSTNNRIIFRAFTTGSADQCVIRSASSTVATLTSAAPTTATRKSAIAYKVNDFAFTSAGQTPVTDTAGAVPTGLSVVLLGSGSGTSEFLGGYLRRITYYPRRLSDSELQGITT